MNWKEQQNLQLVAAFLSLKNPDETQRFLRDLMTETEIEEFAKRLETARLLEANTPYTTIRKLTGLSSTTIARVSKWLQSAEGGYRLALARIHCHTPIPRGGGVR